MRTWLSSVIIAVLAVGCAADHKPSVPEGTAQQGLAELHVDAHSLIAASVTRVTVTSGDQSQDLTLNALTGSFDGSLLLASGTQSLVASAFAGDTLVGQSQPTPVAVQIGVVTRVILRILDLTTGPGQLFGPIFNSLAFPTTTEINQSVSFAISVIAPAGDPVTYLWTSDCADSILSAPGAATTQFTKPTTGACTITITATSNGLSVGQSFTIAVFPTGATSGALQIDTTFVTAPVLALQLQDLGCATFTSFMAINSSCQTTTASPNISSYAASVQSWGGSDPGTLTVTDSCGGGIGVTSSDASDIFGQWLPAAAGGACFITARAVNADGVSSSLSLAVLVRPGTPAFADPPSLFAEYETGCTFGSPSFPTSCGSFFAGNFREVFYEVFLADGHIGTQTLVDDCVGPQQLPVFSNGSFVAVGYVVPNQPSRTCTTTLHATTLEGSSSDVVGQYQLIGQ